MKIIKTQKQITSFLKALEKRSSGVSPEIISTVSNILESIRKRGDKALKSYTKRFDGHVKLKLTPSEIKRYATKADPDVVKALKESAKRIRKFHKHQMEKSWTIEEKGIRLGQLIRPIERGLVMRQYEGGPNSYIYNKTEELCNKLITKFNVKAITSLS